MSDTQALAETVYAGLMKGDDGESAPFIALTALHERVVAAERERDEWKREADLSKWPKEAAAEYNHMKVALPAVESKLEAATDALRRIEGLYATKATPTSYYQFAQDPRAIARAVLVGGDAAS